MIAPTIGRKVWYWPALSVVAPRHSAAQISEFKQLDDAQPMDATIVFVHNDRMVNLRVLDHVGNSRNVIAVTLLQGDETGTPADGYCQWMPYQHGQAKKDEKPKFLNPALGEPFADTKNGKPTVIHLTPTEIQSGSTRVDWAEGLIRQLPETHDGRNSWLLNHGSDAKARQAGWSRMHGRAVPGSESSPVTDEMVSRFLAWKLPPGFVPDCGISFDRDKALNSPYSWPTGTNLLDASQARAMLEHVLGLGDKNG